MCSAVSLRIRVKGSTPPAGGRGARALQRPTVRARPARRRAAAPVRAERVRRRLARRRGRDFIAAMKSTTLRRVMRPLRPEPLTAARSTRYSAASRRTAGDNRISPRGAALRGSRQGASDEPFADWAACIAPLRRSSTAASRRTSPAAEPRPSTAGAGAEAAGRAGAGAGAGAAAAWRRAAARSLPRRSRSPRGPCRLRPSFRPARRIFVITPATSDGTSIETLSVSTSNRISSTATVSPTFLCQFATVPSATVSPSCGINTSIGASSVLCETWS